MPLRLLSFKRWFEFHSVGRTLQTLCLYVRVTGPSPALLPSPGYAMIQQSFSQISCFCVNLIFSLYSTEYKVSYLHYCINSFLFPLLAGPEYIEHHYGPGTKLGSGGQLMNKSQSWPSVRLCSCEGHGWIGWSLQRSDTCRKRPCAELMGQQRVEWHLTYT